MYDVILLTDVTDTIPVYKTIGAHKLAYELRERGYSCLVVDRLHSFSIDELIKLMDCVIGSKTLLVGISTTFLQNSNVQKDDSKPIVFTPLSNDTFLPQGKDAETYMVSYIKKLNQRTQIVVGGTKAHSNYTNKNADYAILGYAESSIINLADHLSVGSVLTNTIKNVWGVKVIDDRTAALYDFRHSKMSWEKLDVVNYKILPFEVARGCIFKCKFCSYPMNGKKNLDFIRSTENMMYELEKNFYEHGVDTYTILDDTFNDNLPKLKMLLDAVKKLKFQPKFWAYTRLDLMAKHPETMSMLYDIGIRGVQFGIETLNRKTGKIIGKGLGKKKQIETVQYLRNKFENKISLHGTFIVGLPEENEDSVRQTFDTVMSQDMPLHSWRWFPLGISKKDKVPWSSDISLNFKEYGYREVTTNPDSILINWENDFMDYTKAVRLATEFNTLSEQSPNFFIPNILGWGLLELGFTMDQITSTNYKDLNWASLSKSKAEFDNNYKQQLFSLLGIVS